MKNVVVVMILIICMSVSALAQEAKTQTEVEGRKERTSSVECYQNGQLILEEKALRSFRLTADALYGQRQDGVWITVVGIGSNTTTACRIVEQPDEKSH